MKVAGFKGGPCFGLGAAFTGSRRFFAFGCTPYSLHLGYTLEYYRGEMPKDFNRNNILQYQQAILY